MEIYLSKFNERIFLIFDMTSNIILLNYFKDILFAIAKVFNSEVKSNKLYL